MITVAQAAVIIGVGEPMVRRYCADGRLPAIRAGKRLWLIAERDARKFKRRPPGRKKITCR
jgi:excisionase family DNA binding protein